MLTKIKSSVPLTFFVALIVVQSTNFVLSAPGGGCLYCNLSPGGEGNFVQPSDFGYEEEIPFQKRDNAEDFQEVERVTASPSALSRMRGRSMTRKIAEVAAKAASKGRVLMQEAAKSDTEKLASLQKSGLLTSLVGGLAGPEEEEAASKKAGASDAKKPGSPEAKKPVSPEAKKPVSPEAKKPVPSEAKTPIPSEAKNPVAVDAKKVEVKKVVRPVKVANRPKTDSTGKVQNGTAGKNETDVSTEISGTPLDASETIEPMVFDTTDMFGDGGSMFGPSESITASKPLLLNTDALRPLLGFSSSIAPSAPVAAARPTSGATTARTDSNGSTTESPETSTTTVDTNVTSTEGIRSSTEDSVSTTEEAATTTTEATSTTTEAIVASTETIVTSTEATVATT